MLWAFQANNLKRVAENALKLAKRDIKEKLTAYHRVDLLNKFLVSVALENLLKGIMIIDDPNLVRRRSLSRTIRYGQDMLVAD